MIPVLRDTLLVMSDRLPLSIKYSSFNSDSIKWDLNGVKSPFIQRLKLIKDESIPIAFIKSNASIQINQTTREYLKITADTILSYGISGIDLFNNGYLYSGIYDSPRLFKSKANFNSRENTTNKFKLIYDCDLRYLPVAIQSQLPYRPDSMRVITLIEETTINRNDITLDLNLQRYHTVKEDRTMIQSTRIETRKSSLAWQDVTRFIKFPKLFKIDTIRIASFYVDSIGTPIASLYYKSNEEMDRIEYQAPETFKDLIIVDDYKPNLFFFPNPYAVGALRCDMIIKNSGLYTARIVSLIGNELWRQNYYLEQSKTIDLDFSFLNRGTYFFV